MGRAAGAGVPPSREGAAEAHRVGGVQEHGIRRHFVAPILPVFIPDHEADGTAEGPAPAHTGIDLDRVLFDLHPAAAAVTNLPPGKIAVDVRNPDQKAGRHALDDSHQQFAVGFSGS